MVWVELLYRSLEKIIEVSISGRFCLQKCRADAVVDHADQHGGRHVLSSALPRSHRFSEEVQPATPAGDNVQAVRGNDSDSEPHLLAFFKTAADSLASTFHEETPRLTQRKRIASGPWWHSSFSRRPAVRCKWKLCLCMETTALGRCFNN